MASPPSPALALREYFLLAEARATSVRLPEPRRAAIADTLTVGRQRGDAADALWTLGHTAEGLRLAVDALGTTLRAASELAVGLGLAQPDAPAEADAAETLEKIGAAPGGDAKPESDAEPQSESDAEPESESDAEPKSATEPESDAEPQSEAEPQREAEAEPKSGAEPEAEPVRAGPPATSLASRERAPAGSAAWRAALSARGLGEAKLRQLETLTASVAALALPTLDEEVSPSHAELFRELLAARRDVEKALAPASMTLGQIARTRATRFAALGTVAVLLAVGAYLLLRTPHEGTATASAVYGNRPEFQPDRLVDDDIETEWLLPDNTEGWVEVRLSPPRSISTVRLRNAHNRDILDRAAKDYTVELYSNGEVAVSRGGQFSRIEADPQWAELEMSADQVDRIRVVVRTWHRNGGGLAELDWDEE